MTDTPIYYLTVLQYEGDYGGGKYWNGTPGSDVWMGSSLDAIVGGVYVPDDAFVTMQGEFQTEADAMKALEEFARQHVDKHGIFDIRPDPVTAAAIREKYQKEVRETLARLTKASPIGETGAQHLATGEKDRAMNPDPARSSLRADEGGLSAEPTVSPEGRSTSADDDLEPEPPYPFLCAFIDDAYPNADEQCRIDDPRAGHWQVRVWLRNAQCYVTAGVFEKLANAENEYEKWATLMRNGDEEGYKKALLALPKDGWVRDPT